jgi:hypothetical protein
LNTVFDFSVDSFILELRSKTLRQTESFGVLHCGQNIFGGNRRRISGTKHYSHCFQWMQAACQPSVVLSKMRQFSRSPDVANAMAGEFLSHPQPVPSSFWIERVLEHFRK